MHNFHLLNIPVNEPRGRKSIATAHALTEILGRIEDVVGGGGGGRRRRVRTTQRNKYEVAAS